MAKKKKLTLPEKIAELRNQMEEHNTDVHTRLEELEAEVADLIAEYEAAGEEEEDPL